MKKYQKKFIMNSKNIIKKLIKQLLSKKYEARQWHTSLHTNKSYLQQQPH